jgi:catechol 2,3-dioxygenase-like lactoylglutathione lyase family enzyme
MRSPLDRIRQIAYAVTDVADAAERFARRTGAGPFFVVEHIPVASAVVFGEPRPFDHSSAYGQWGDVMVELVAEHTPPIVAPGSGVHHVACWVDSLDAGIAWGAAQGWPTALLAETTAGQRFAFLDARAELGHLVELYEPTERLVAFFARVAAAAEGWDGSDPVRHRH